MIALFQIGGPASQNEWLILFFIVACVATAFIGGEYLEHKGKKLDRKQERINRDSELLSKAMLEGRCTICQQRHDALIKPFDWAKDSGDAA